MTTRASSSLTEDSIRQLSQAHNEPAWLLQRRLDALRAYEAMAMPDPMAEEWRRTDLTTVDIDAALAATGDNKVQLIAESLPDGVVFMDLSRAATQHEALVQKHLHSLVLPTEWKLGALQAAAWQDGALIYVPAGVEVEMPLRYLLDHGGAPAFTHLLIVAEDNASLTVFNETSGQAAQGWSMLSGAVEIVAGPNSRVRFFDIQNLGQEGVINFSTTRADLDKGAELTSSILGLGSILTKSKLDVLLSGEGSHADILGLSFGATTQHFDYNTLQEHIAPKTTSDLLLKAALTDSSSQVWYGTVHIGKGAHGSQANQTSRNLLLSDHAKAAPIPVLEIEAFDILRCSHGASAGPLDEEQRFYLESRGIPAPEAQRLLVEAFFHEVVDRIPNDAVRDRIKAVLEAKIEAHSK